MITKKELEGCYLNGIQITKCKQALKLLTDKGESIAVTDADCCSYTWIEHIDIPFNEYPAKILKVEDVEMPDLGDIKGCDVVEYYGCKICTDKGDIIIDYRNDSNGYYGGYLFWSVKPDPEYVFIDVDINE